LFDIVFKNLTLRYKDTIIVLDCDSFYISIENKKNPAVSEKTAGFMAELI